MDRRVARRLLGDVRMLHASAITTTDHVDQEENETILTLPRDASSLAMAAVCRETLLVFLNESPHWGKAELAMWLMGPYAQIARYAGPTGRTQSGERAVPLLREIDARMVERVIRTAREEVLRTLERLAEPEAAARFAAHMIRSGFVVRCEDAESATGWLPTTSARRLADRLLSLLAADTLTRPHEALSAYFPEGA